MDTKKRLWIDLNIWAMTQIESMLPSVTEKQIFSLPVSCLDQKASVLFFFNGNKIHYTVLYPDGYYKKGVFDILENINVDFDEYITEMVQCDIAINYTQPIPAYRAVELFTNKRNVK